MKKIGIVAGRKDIAKEFLIQLVGDTPIKEFEGWYDHPNQYLAKLKNGDTYQASSVGLSLMGIKFDILYIHEDTVDEEFKTKVAPSISPNVKYFRI